MAKEISAKLAALNVSLDELEAKLEPLFSQTLPESVVGLEKIQQAKLQVLLPYVVYDLIFVYLKTRGIDPKTHPVVAELDRVRQYFNKIKDVEDPAKRTLALDKGAVNRFIKHAIAQAKYGKPPGEDEGQPSEDVRVPVKVTSKMIARAEYEKEVREQGSEEEEDIDLEIFDEVTDEQVESSPSSEGKGKQKATDEMNDDAELKTGQKRRRPMDPFAGYGDTPKQERSAKSSKSSHPTPTPAASDAEIANDSRKSTPVSDSASKTAAKKARKKNRKTKTST